MSGQYTKTVQSPTAWQRAKLAITAGADLVGFSTAISYATNTVGKWLTDLTTELGAQRIGFTHTATGGTLRTLESKSTDVLDLRDLGIPADGTNQTTAIVNAINALAAASFRGTVRVGAGTAFTVTTVFAAIDSATGITLEGYDTLNWGQPPTYKNKFRFRYTGDLVADDTQMIEGSGHHPAFMLLNMGTKGTGAATSRYASILHGVGRNTNGDPKLGWLFQFAKDPASAQWRISARIQVPYANLGDPNPANIDSTRHDWFESGSNGQYGPNAVRRTMQSGGFSFYEELGTTGSATYVRRDETNGRDIEAISAANGFHIKSPGAVFFTTVSGATPTQAAPGLYVDNAGATSMTNIVMPGAQTSGFALLMFSNGNTTLVHDEALLRLKGAANVTPAAGSIMTFVKHSTHSSAWFEASRSF